MSEEVIKMERLYKGVLSALQKENKEEAVKLSLAALSSGNVTVPELYEMNCPLST